MRELRFARDVYAGDAIDTGMTRLAAFADFEREEDGAAWVVRVTARDGADERAVAGELANFALGLTVEQGGV